MKPNLLSKLNAIELMMLTETFIFTSGIQSLVFPFPKLVVLQMTGGYAEDSKTYNSTYFILKYLIEINNFNSIDTNCLLQKVTKKCIIENYDN